MDINSVSNVIKEALGDVNGDINALLNKLGLENETFSSESEMLQKIEAKLSERSGDQSLAETNAVQSQSHLNSHTKHASSPKIDKLNARLENVDARLESSLNRADNFDQKIEEMQLALVEALEEGREYKIQRVQTRISKLEDDLAETRNRIEEIEARKAELLKQLEDLEKELVQEELDDPVVNIAPVASDDSASLDEDGSVVINLLGNDRDADGDTLTIASLGSVANGTLVNNGDGTVTYTPNANFNGSETLTYSVSDGQGGTSSASVAITVASVNDAPTALAFVGSTTVSEDLSVGSVLGTVSASDVDGDSLSFTLEGVSADKFEIIGNEVRLKNSVDFETDTSHDLQLVVSDGNGGSISQPLKINVTDVVESGDPKNNTPNANDDNSSLDEDGSVVVNLLGNDSDPDGDAIILSSIGAAEHGTIFDNGDGTVTYTAKDDFFGFDVFEYTISDKYGRTSNAKVTMEIKPINDAPVILGSSYEFEVLEFTERLNFIGKVSAYDKEKEGLTYVIESGNPQTDAGYIFGINQDGVIITNKAAPTLLEHEIKPYHDLVIAISDGELTSRVNVRVNVVNVSTDIDNNAPIAVKDRYTIDEDSGPHVFNILENDSDPDGDSFRIMQIQGDSVDLGNAIVNPNGTITYTPNENAIGEERFNYIILDEYGNSSQNVIIININSVNDIPEVENERVTLFKLKPITIGALTLASDADGDDLQITNISDPKHGVVVENADGTLTYTPNTDFDKTDSFTYSISDGNGGVVEATAEFEMVDTVLARDDFFIVNSARVATLNVGGNDQFDPELHSIRLTSMMEEGNLTVNPDGTIALVLKNPEFSGPISFNYEIENQYGNISEATVSLEVQPAVHKSGWGYGEHYMLQTDADGNVIIESGENHRKFFITEGEHGFSRQDIADKEGIDVSEVTARWLSENNPEYGSTEDLALNTDIGMEFWLRMTNDDLPRSDWLIFEKGYEYHSDDVGNMFNRVVIGESALNPIHITSYGDGDIPKVGGNIKFIDSNQNIVFTNLEITSQIRFLSSSESLLEKNFMLDNVHLDTELNLQNVDKVTLRNMSVTDVHHEIPKGDVSDGTWGAFDNRKSGIFVKNSDGILMENTYFDHNGWEAGYSYDMSTDNGHPPSLYSHNIYLQYDTTDVTYRNNISTRSASFGAQFRGGAYLEDNVFFDNNIGFNVLGGDYKDYGNVGNYSLVNGNIVTSAAYRDVASSPGALAWAAEDRALLTTHINNIIAHAANPNDAQEIIDKYITGGPLNTEDRAYYNNNIVYNWYGQKLIEIHGQEGAADLFDKNVDGLDKAMLNKTTIELYAAELMGKEDATVDDLADFLRDNNSSNLDGYTDAEMIVRYFQEGFGITPSLPIFENNTMRFVPNELGEGTRWDNRLNWDKGHTPIDGDNIELGGNWVNFGGTVTINDLDFGLNGELSVGNGYLKVDGDLVVDEGGTRLIVRDSGQFWTNGYSDSDTLDITASGGRFGNLGIFNGAFNMNISGDAQIIFAANDAEMIVNGDDKITISGDNAKVGFDGDNSGDAVLSLDGGTLAFDLDTASTTMIREFKSGHYGDAPDVNSVVDLGQANSSLEIDLQDLALADGIHSFSLIGDIDKLQGDIGYINITGSNTDVLGVRLSFNRATDEVNLDVSMNDESLIGTHVDLYGSDDMDIFYLSGDSGIDEITIHDFDAANGDVLDITDLLEGYDDLSDSLTDFVQITSDGTNSTILIDADGGADNFVKFATFNGTTGLDDIESLEQSGSLQTII